jgi:hypothetical protein
MWAASGVSITRTISNPIRDVSTPNGRRPVTGYEDRHAVVVTVPVVDLLRGAPTPQHRTGGVDRVGGDRDVQTPGGVASVRERVTHDGDCLVPIVRIDLYVPGDDRHEEVLAFKTQGGR